MKKNRWCLRLIVLLVISGIVNLTAALAVEVGSSEDPLVTLSYLNEVFLQDVMAKVDQKISQRNQDIVKEMGGQVSDGGMGSTDTFTVVTLTKGQVLIGDIGCEVMLRVGTAECVSSSAPGLINQTSGEVLNNGGVLVKNHMYMMTIEGRGVKATADTTKVLARGTYIIA